MVWGRRFFLGFPEYGYSSPGCVGDYPIGEGLDDLLLGWGEQAGVRRIGVELVQRIKDVLLEAVLDEGCGYPFGDAPNDPGEVPSVGGFGLEPVEAVGDLVE